MRIAVCDDDFNDRQVLNEYISRFDASLERDLYTSAEDLIDALRSHYYDLIFLDIEMEGLDGFHAAKEITGTEDDPLIVFVTKSSKYTIQGYEVAFRYLVKPVVYDDFAKVMKAAVEQIAPNKISIEINGKNYLISTKEIYYFEVFNHNIRVRTKENSYECRSTLKSLEDLLDGCPFVRPHNSFLINLEHVVTFTQSEIIMKDHLKIIISRKKKDEFFRAMHQYLRR